MDKWLQKQYAQKSSEDLTAEIDALQKEKCLLYDKMQNTSGASLEDLRGDMQFVEEAIAVCSNALRSCQK